MDDLLDADKVVQPLIGKKGWSKPRSKEVLHLHNPSTQQEEVQVYACSKADVDDALADAASAVQNWENLPLSERAKCLHNAASNVHSVKEVLASRLISEIAKPRADALAEVSRTVDMLHAVAEEGLRLLGRSESRVSDGYYNQSRGKLCIQSYCALGTVLCIAPSNFPVNLSCSKVAPALMCGNAAVLKPPTQGASAALFFMRQLQAALPVDGLVCALPGRSSDIGDYMCSHPHVNLISFTGSTRAGNQIGKVSGTTPLQFELGGKDLAIVLPDADLDHAAKQCVKGAFTFSGQRCTATKIIAAYEDIADNLVKKLQAQIDKLTVGSAHDNCDVVPLFSNQQAEYVCSMCKEAQQCGAVGELRRDEDNPALLHPTLFDCTKCPNARICWEEQFAPVLPLVRVQNETHALRFVNESEYGLQGSVFTSNLDSAMRLSAQMRTGTVQVNAAPSRGPDHFPFCGAGKSFVGEPQGIPESIRAMAKMKTTVISLPSSGSIAVSK